MGSTSSKDHDANPHDLGTNATSPRGGGGQYPMQHHPQYGQGDASAYNSAYGSGMPPGAPHYGAQGGHQGVAAGGDRGGGSSGSGGGGGAGAGDAMEVDQTTGDLPYGIAGSSNEAGSEDTTSIVPTNDVVPMVFRWEHGGRNVYITGTFNGWSKQCPMHRSGNDFTYIANLTRGKHAYKFVVDEEWRFAPDQLTVADVEGNVNNFVDVSDFQPLSDFDFAEDTEKDDDQYGRFIPDIDEYTKEPPPLPPHLRHIILNKNPPSVDTRLLPVPQHVALNHLYCTAIKDGMMVLGVTQRYKQKFVTTVYYSLMPGTT